MTWTKLSDDFSDDCWELSDAAVRLHMEGLVWSNRKLLDCRLVKDDMVRWAKRPGAAEELVNAGWWRDEGDCYLIVHHARYQRTREVMLKLQERNQRNGASGGRPPKVARERFSPQETQVGCQVETQRDGTGRDGPGREGDQLSKSDREKIDDNSTSRELGDWFAAGADYEPPPVDPDGFPLDGV